MIEGLKLLVLPLVSAVAVWRINHKVLNQVGVMMVREKARWLALSCGAVLVVVVIWGSVRGLQQFQNGEFMFQKWPRIVRKNRVKIQHFKSHPNRPIKALQVLAVP